MTQSKHKGERIAKVMARAGVCSRRDAEKWIEAGKVEVNGKVIKSPALNVTESDKIYVNGKILPQKEPTRLFLYHKPPGLVTTHKDERDRSTVFENLPDFMPRVVSVGRLDLNTEGLLLLTNDGELARFLELPETGWARQYRVRVHGKVNPKRLESLKSGITVEGVRYKSIDAKIEEKAPDQASGTNSWITMSLREGKNREIRRVMEALGLNVTRLIRTDYGPFSLGKMTRGSVIEVKSDVMKHQLAKFFAGKSSEAHAEKQKTPHKTKKGHRNTSANRKFVSKKRNSPKKPSQKGKKS